MKRYGECVERTQSRPTALRCALLQLPILPRPPRAMRQFREGKDTHPSYRNEATPFPTHPQESLTRAQQPVFHYTATASVIRTNESRRIYMQYNTLQRSVLSTPNT